MKTQEIDFSDFPYDSFSEIRIRSNEPMSYAYFNSHIVRLCSNIDSLKSSFTLQKATYNQWGTVRFATVSDIIDDGDKTTVISNKTMNDALAELKKRNQKEYLVKHKLNFSKNYEFRHGEFIVGVGEKVARKIIDCPERVVFANVDYIPLGFESKPFYTSKVSTTAPSAYESGVESSGIINFVDWKKPEGYTEFHVYYHNSGYVICENGQYNDGQKQIKVIWNLFVRKDN